MAKPNMDLFIDYYVYFNVAVIYGIISEKGTYSFLCF